MSARRPFRQRLRDRASRRPVAAVFVRTHLTPNMLTLIGFGIAVVGAYLAAIQLWIPAGLVVGFGAAFDMFDGALARATGKSSKLGAFMDSHVRPRGRGRRLCRPRVGLLHLGDVNGATLAAAAMAAAFMVSYTRAKSESLGFNSGTGMANVGLAPREVRTVILVSGPASAAGDSTCRVARSGPWASSPSSPPSPRSNEFSSSTTNHSQQTRRSQEHHGQRTTARPTPTATAARPSARTARSASRSSAWATARAASCRAATTTRTPRTTSSCPV